MDPQVRLGIDYGTSNTVAVLHTSGRPARMLLFDGSPQLPSSIFADPDGGFLTGRDAVHSARTDPTRVDPNPKRRINDQFVLLGTVEFPVADLIAATLRRVHGEAERVAGVPVAETVLTYPAAWGPPRRGVLAAAVQRAGLSALSLVPEPVAAAAYFVEVLGARLPLGHCLVVYDFGAGTFDASVVRRVPGGFTVLATEGLPETGGLDVDAAVIEYLGTAGAGWDPALRARLDQPQATDDLRAHGLLWQDARSAKEMLSRASSTFIHVPLVDVDVPLGREQFENLARPILDQTMAATQRAVQAAGVRPDEIAGVFPVGGSSRIPLVATLLHRTFRLAPTVLDQPELVVAEGAALAVPSGGPRPVSGAPVSGTPVSGTPESVSPVSPAATLPLPRLPAPRSGVPAMPPRPVPGGSGPAGRGHPPSGRRTRRASPLLAVLIPLIVVLLGVVGFLGARVGAEILGDRGTPTTAAATTPSAKQTTARAISPPSVSAPSLTPPTATPPTLGFPAAMAGTWSGQMVQSNGTRWPMRVTIQAGADRAKVSYPSAGCTGVWTMLAHVEELVVAHEYISEGSCTVRGEMGLVLDDRDALIVEYKPEKAEYTATATLIRSASTPET